MVSNHFLSNDHRLPRLTQWILTNGGLLNLKTDSYWYDSNRAAGFEVYFVMIKEKGAWGSMGR